MNYGQKLKELRTNNNLTQNDIANILNIARGLYSQYEIMDKIIPLPHLNKLTNYFNVSIDYCLGINNEKKYNNSKTKMDTYLFSLRLKEFRKEQKLTQLQLATFLNTTHSVISAYEHGKTLIITSFLYTICSKYNISADYLLGKVDEPKYLK